LPPIAAKVVDIESPDEESEIEAEIKILKTCVSPFVVGFRYVERVYFALLNN
jgi:hypothetical protein